ncbi:MAG: hypothetical protein EBR01_02695 [Proteobacteria bacterium]|nr:hypothetical protein [Pseudomonadota bacterium]
MKISFIFRGYHEVEFDREWKTGRGGGLGTCQTDLIDIFLENRSKQKLAGLQLPPKSTEFYEIPI